MVIAEKSAIAAEGKLFASVPLQTWKDWTPSISSAGTRSTCPRRSTRRSSISTRRRCATFQSSAHAGSAASISSTEQSARASARSTSSAISRPESEQQMHELIGNILAALKDKIEGNSWMDARNEEARAGQARDLRSAHRPSGQIYRLFLARGETRRSARQCAALRQVRLGPPAFALSKAGRPDLVGHAPADQQCLLRPDAEPDHLPGGDPSAALFRSRGRCGIELRQHRRDDRARDRARLRRPGPAVRRAWQAHRLVDAGDREALHRPCRQARRPVQQLRADPGRAHQRPADARRESRRSRWPRSRLCRLSQICRRSTASRR